MSQTNAQLLADSLGTISTGTIPIGGIILWSGSIASIPDGWALCNGGNGTPNLQDRFVLGASSDGADTAYPVVRPGGTGGSANAVVVAHNHTGTVTGAGTHGHSYEKTNGGTDHNGDGNDIPLRSTVTAANVGGNGAHSHGVSINPAGSSATNANLPPYYALAYIMRTS